MIQVGDKVYLFSHAYHHIVGEVVEVLGVRGKHVELKDVRRVQSCSRGWTEFFAQGFLGDTTYTVWPDGTEVDGWFIKVPWNHPIPGAPK